MFYTETLVVVTSEPTVYGPIVNKLIKYDHEFREWES